MAAHQGQLLQRRRGELVVEAGLGRPPLHHEPLELLGAGGGPIAVEHHQGRIRSTAVDQGVGLGQHHRQGLGRRIQRQQAALQQGKAGPVTRP